MNEKFNCSQCKKIYKSYQSLWNHNKRFHLNSLQNISQYKPEDKSSVSQNKPSRSIQNIKTEDEIEKKDDSKKYICKYCSNKFVFNQSKWKHEQKCKNNININKITELEAENKKLKEDMQEQMNELRKQLLDLMNKKCKVHHKTYQKIKNNGNIIGTNTNNTNNISYNIVNFGSENVSELLSDKEKIEILKHKARAIYT